MISALIDSVMQAIAGAMGWAARAHVVVRGVTRVNRQGERRALTVCVELARLLDDRL